MLIYLAAGTLLICGGMVALGGYAQKKAQACGVQKRKKVYQRPLFYLFILLWAWFGYGLFTEASYMYHYFLRHSPITFPKALWETFSETGQFFFPLALLQSGLYWLGAHLHWVSTVTAAERKNFQWNSSL